MVGFLLDQDGTLRQYSCMQYRPVIGLETHIQLNTATKLMCSCLNEYNPDYPNQNICEFCTGQPGALPTLNQEAVRKAIKLGVALGSTIPEITSFDRKNYFYPDLPNGYQISQFGQPIVSGGELSFYIDNKDTGELTNSKVEITRAHLETDAAKLIHAGGKTMVDFNRSGAPLIEIVTEPVIHSAEQAMAYVNELQLLVRKLNISNADMEKGQMRFDINISLQTEDQTKTDTLPSYRAEVKNVNSVRSLGRTIAYEIERQKKLLESGTTPSQETRGWDDESGTTSVQRSKEDAMDYRYFPEPDLLPIQISTADIPLVEELLELPARQRTRYTEQGLNINTALVLTNQSEMGQLYDQVNALLSSANADISKTLANIITVVLPPKAEDKKIDINSLVTPNNLLALAELFATKQINNQSLDKALDIVIQDPEKDVLEVVAVHNLMQVNDDSVLMAFVEAVVANNATQVEQYKTGKVAVLGYLVGQCMKESKGTGNPQKFQDLLTARLAE
jgi:aspartyl-tRNA(Asn)/glutamyl-tRNA(Gln) amidotransferase subunit B